MNKIKISDFDFDLPTELIAQTPLANRTDSRLMVINRQANTYTHRYFAQIAEYLEPGDLLILNDSRVRPARLIGHKVDTGAKIELLLLKPLGEDRWEALVKPAKRVKEGTVIQFGDGELQAIAEETSTVAGGRFFRLSYDTGAQVEDLFVRLGKMPLPPYIHSELDDAERYQTVYSREIGSAAAPTAGLHFTDILLTELKQQGVNIAFVTLHVGLGTFRPVTAKTIENHQMHAEFFQLPQATVDLIVETKRQKRRVIAVGTTSVRTLESVAQQNNGDIQAMNGWTDIFIHPGYTFQVVDGLITNFHLPKSTLLMLVSAFSSQDQILTAYQAAIQQQYRFFSFGDAMFIY